MFIVTNGRAPFFGVCSLIQIDINALQMQMEEKEKCYHKTSADHADCYQESRFYEFMVQTFSGLNMAYGNVYE